MAFGRQILWIAAALILVLGLLPNVASGLPISDRDARSGLCFSEFISMRFSGWSLGFLGKNSASSSSSGSTSGATGLGMGSKVAGVGSSSAGGEEGGQALAFGTNGLGLSTNE